MKTLITGAGGQLGREIKNLIPDALTPKKDELDLRNPEGVYSYLLREKPDQIFNCGAMTDVDKCETERLDALKINALSPVAMARYASMFSARLIHFSTDYVFDGERGNYSEDDVPDPINYYGKSKLLGDFALLPVPNSIIIRTSGVFGNKMNFPLFVYRNLKEGREIRAIESFYSPISAGNLARASVELNNMHYNGLINISGERISRYEFAIKIAKHFNLDENLVKRSTEISGGRARRPLDSSLCIDKAKNIIKWDFHSAESNIPYIGEI